jgi:protocatechuate 3,4-dioxygenase beta subunit
LLTLLILFCGLLAPQPAAAQTGSISGFVVDTLGNRISGATVAATSGPSAPVQTTSAADGSYLLSRLNAGSYVFTANRNGYTGTSRSFTVNGGVSARLDFTIRSETTQGAVIQGHITQRGTSVAVAGARVDLTGGAGVVSQSTTTDESGFYSFSNLTTGRIRLAVTRAGYYNETRLISVTQGRSFTADFTLRLRASQLATLSGVVSDTEGVAIRGAVVTLSDGVSSGMRDTTDSRGRYSITRVIPDTYTVSVTAPGFVSSTPTSVILDQDETEVLNVTLSGVGASTAGITGLVVDSDGQPITGARVAITGGPVTGRSDTTDVTGLYEILNLPAGTYTLRASATGFNPQTRTVSITVDTSTQLDFTLSDQVNQLLGSITGRITQSDGSVISDVTVKITAGPTKGQTVQSDDQGDYGIPDLPEGTYTLSFTHSGYATRTVTGVDVIAGRATTLDAVLGISTSGGVLAGTVTDTNGTAVVSATVKVLQNSSVIGTATTGSQGTYRISSLPVGTYVVQFSKSGFTTAQVSGVEITAGASTTVDAQLTTSGSGLGTLSGLVVDSLGRPVQGAVVELSGASGDLTTTTDADGTFQFANLTPATNYTLTVTASGYVTDARRNVVVTANEDANVRVELVQDSTSGGSLSGFVRSQSGAAIAGATVRIVAGPAVGQTRTTSSTGQFSFAGLPGGAYTIEVRSVNFRPARLTVNVRVGGGAFVTVTLQRQ